MFICIYCQEVYNYFRSYILAARLIIITCVLCCELFDSFIMIIYINTYCAKNLLKASDACAMLKMLFKYVTHICKISRGDRARVLSGFFFALPDWFACAADVNPIRNIKLFIYA